MNEKNCAKCKKLCEMHNLLAENLESRNFGVKSSVEFTTFLKNVLSTLRIYAVDLDKYNGNKHFGTSVLKVSNNVRLYLLCSFFEIAIQRKKYTKTKTHKRKGGEKICCGTRGDAEACLKTSLFI